MAQLDSGGFLRAIAEKEKPGAPSFGRPGEKRVRERLDPKHNYGGRDECPDDDVNDVPREPGSRRRESHESCSSSFSSGLPDEAFERGDLFNED